MLVTSQLQVYCIIMQWHQYLGYHLKWRRCGMYISRMQGGDKYCNVVGHSHLPFRAKTYLAPFFIFIFIDLSSISWSYAYKITIERMSNNNSGKVWAYPGFLMAFTERMFLCEKKGPYLPLSCLPEAEAEVVGSILRCAGREGNRKEAAPSISP